MSLLITPAPHRSSTFRLSCFLSSSSLAYLGRQGIAQVLGLRLALWEDAHHAQERLGWISSCLALAWPCPDCSDLLRRERTSKWWIFSAFFHSSSFPFFLSLVSILLPFRCTNKSFLKIAYSCLNFLKFIFSTVVDFLPSHILSCAGLCLVPIYSYWPSFLSLCHYHTV